MSDEPSELEITTEEETQIMPPIHVAQCNGYQGKNSGETIPPHEYYTLEKPFHSTTVGVCDDCYRKYRVDMRSAQLLKKANL